MMGGRRNIRCPDDVYRFAIIFSSAIYFTIDPLYNEIWAGHFEYGNLPTAYK